MSAISEALRRRIDELRDQEQPPSHVDVVTDAHVQQLRAEAWLRVVPHRFHHAVVDQLDGDLATLAEQWDGQRNVLLVGAVGVGKTHAAVAMARGQFLAGQAVAYMPVVELLDQLRPGGDQTIHRRACDVDVLILDDLGAERPSDWTAERLYAIVNRRWLEQRPTLVTSNLPVDVLEQTVGTRMWSRLWHDALRLVIAGNDRRRQDNR